MLPDTQTLLLLSAAVALGLLWCWIFVNLVSLNRQRRLFADQLLRRVARASELAWLLENRERLAEWQEASERVLDEGTATVRAIHHAIASIPFAILEAIPATRDTTRVVHGVHDFTANGVYAGIALANRALGGQLRHGLGRNRTGQSVVKTGREMAREPEPNASIDSGQTPATGRTLPDSSVGDEFPE